MSKRVESKKTAVFELEPDGFSIHTFELSQKLTRKQCHQMKDELYQLQEQPGDEESFSQAVRSWTSLRNAECRKIYWQFTAADARIKLAKRYPTTV